MFADLLWLKPYGKFVILISPWRWVHPSQKDSEWAREFAWQRNGGSGGVSSVIALVLSVHNLIWFIMPITLEAEFIQSKKEVVLPFSSLMGLLGGGGVSGGFWMEGGLLRWDLQWQRRHNVRPDRDGCAVKMATVISLNRSFNSIITVDEEWISCLIKCCNSATAHIHVWTTVLLQIQITLDWKFIGLISMKDWRFPL